jgi:hypothetical protein
MADQENTESVLAAATLTRSQSQQQIASAALIHVKTEWPDTEQ